MNAVESSIYQAGQVTSHRAQGQMGLRFRLRLGQKLLAGYLGMAVLMALLGGFGLAQLRRIDTANAEIGHDWLPSTHYLGLVDTESTMFHEAQQLRSKAGAPSE